VRSKESAEALIREGREKNTLKLSAIRRKYKKIC